jgi:hypothetical protein
MKEVEKKDVPAVSGGMGWDIAPLPDLVVPLPDYPPNPGLPGEPPDPLGDRLRKNQIQS